MAALISLSLSFLHKLSLYFQLTKPRLSVVVVFSAVMGAMLAGMEGWEGVVWLLLGGYAITGAANAANQVWERESDRLMERTRGRPLPAGLVSVGEGLLVSVLLGLVGVLMLGALRWDVAAWGFLAWALYVLAYTPLKQKGVLAVVVGALPGALPPVIGYWAVRPEATPFLGWLFLLQFLWQFPHFWVIAWLAQEDYARAGFRMLPFAYQAAEKNRLALLLSVWALPVGAATGFLWGLPEAKVVWALLLGLGVGVWAWRGLRRPTRRTLRSLLLALTGYLTFLYLGLWLLS